MELPTQMLFVFVAEEPFSLAACAFDQDPSRRPGVHRIKVIAVLDVGCVGVAQLLVDSLLLFQFFVAVHGQGDVMHCPGSKAPASGGAIGIVFKDQSLSWTAGTHLEAVKLAFVPGLAETQSLREEALAFGHFAHRKYSAVEAAEGFAGADLFRGPTLPVVVRILEDFKRQPGGVLEANVLLAEALLNARVLNLVLIEVLFPKRQRAFGRRIRGSADL